MFNKIYLRKMINLEKHAYNKFVENYTEILLKDYRSNIREFTYEIIDKPLKSPFLKDKTVVLDADGELYEATHGNCLSLLVVYTVLNKLYNRGAKIDSIENYIFDLTSSGDFENGLDQLYMDYITFPDIKNIIFECVSQLAKISAKFVSGTISLRDIYMLRKKNPQFEKILKFNVDENESFASMINDINENKDRLQNFLTHTDSSYRPMITSNSGFNFKQASQIFNLIGPKPDVFGNIHTHPILTNFINGLQSEKDYYVNADNCRKA